MIKRYISISFILLSVFLAAEILLNLKLNSYEVNWNIDHYIYISSRILKGKLMWADEYHDKLPIIQYLFLPSFLSKSIKPFIIFNISLGIFSSAHFSFNNLSSYNQKILSKYKRNFIKIAPIFFYLILVSTSPDSWQNINATASSFTLLCISLRLFDNNPKPYLSYKYYFAALLAALSISLRPYLAATLIMFEIWFFHKMFYRNFNIRILKIFITRNLIWVISILIFAITINFSPYLFTNNISYIPNAISILKQSLIPQTFFHITKSHIYIILYYFQLIPFFSLFLVVPLIYIYFNDKKDKLLTSKSSYKQLSIDIFYGVILSPVLIYIVVLSKHFWGNYIILYIPFCILAFTILFRLILIFDLDKVLKKHNLYSNLILTLLSISLVVGGDNSIKSFQSLFVKDNNAFYSRFVEIEKYLSKSNNNKSFLALDDMYVHWKLRESRHGFPHAAHIRHISRGWWEEIESNNKLKTPSNNNDLCKMLNKEGPDIIFDKADTKLLNCLSHENSNYKKVKRQFNDFTKLEVFERINYSQ